MIRFTLTALQPDGSSRVLATGDGPLVDHDNPTLPPAVRAALDDVYGSFWWIEAMWSGGWIVKATAFEQPVTVGHIDYGPTPEEPHPDQASLFGGGT